MQPPQITFMALILAHLLGDFPLQWAWIAKNKCHRSWPLACHGLIHFALAWTCLLLFADQAFFSFPNQIIVFSYVIWHLLIDKLKCTFKARPRIRSHWLSFLTDQLLHALTAAAAAMLLSRASVTAFTEVIRISGAAKTHVLETAIVYLAVIFGGGYFIRSVTSGLADDIASEPAGQMANAGMYVGWIERFLVITAIVMQSPTLIGLILTGKSIARFPEFEEPRFAEYFLIGTLLSLSISVLGGLLLHQLFYGTISLK
jgi:hypothetical protein